MPTGIKPTEKEIEAELKELKRLAPIIPQRSFFGDSNRAIIDTEIRTLEKRMSIDDVEEKYGDYDTEEDSHRYDYALAAAQWLAGQGEDDNEAPSVGWQQLVYAKKRNT